jgi:hypothetical protein
LGLALDGGDEILYSDQLIIGQEYFICVNNTNNVAGNGVISLSYLRGSQADIGPFTNYTGVYNSTCSNFKAAYRFGAYQYTIQRLSENDPLGNIEYSYTIPNTGGAVASTICQLGKILSANLSGIPQTFYVRVDVQYWMPDAYGNFEMLVAPGLNASTIGLNSESDLFVRTTDQCPVYKRVSSSIATNRSICGTSEYNWQFTIVYPQVGLPMEWTGGYGGSRMFPLSMLEGIANGQRYDVRIQSSHIDGASISDFGSVKCVRTLGAAGMLMEDPERFSVTEVDGVKLYPNPNNGEIITLNITGMDGNIMISILDATGRLLQSTTGYSEGNLIKGLEFAQTLSSGLYEVRVSSGKDQKVARMMVGR